MRTQQTIQKQPMLLRIGHYVKLLNGGVLTLLAFTLVGCVTWQVLSRYVTSAPSTTTDELARFMFMWIGLLGAAQASALKQHLAIDLMAMKLQGIAKKLLTIGIELCIIAFAGSVMVWGGWLLTSKTFTNQQVTPALQIPMGYIYSVVPIAGVLLIFFSVIAIYEALIISATSQIIEEE